MTPLINLSKFAKLINLDVFILTLHKYMGKSTQPYDETC